LIDRTAKTVRLLAGDPTFEGVDDGVGSAARFYRPRGIATDGTNLYVADFRSLRKVAISTGEVTTFASGFSDAVAVAIDGGTLWVADSGSRELKRVDIATAAVTTLSTEAFHEVGDLLSIAVDRLGVYVTGATDSPEGARLLRIDKVTGAYTVLKKWRRRTWPPGPPVVIRGVTVNDDAIYVAANGAVLRIDKLTRAETTLTVGGGAGVLAIDGSTLYSTEIDGFGPVLRQRNLVTGRVKTLLGLGETAYRDGVGPRARFSRPWGVVADGGALYVADSGNGRIRRVDPSTGAVTTVAAGLEHPLAVEPAGDALFVADGRAIKRVELANGTTTTLASGFSSVSGLALAGDTLYVADRGLSTIDAVDTTTGVSTRIAGLPEITGHSDGVGDDARFNTPGDLELLGDTLYVTDNCTVRTLDVNTHTVATLAGMSGVCLHVDAPASIARFRGAGALAITDRRLYVSDGDAIRQVDLVSNEHRVSTLTARSDPWSAPPTARPPDYTAGSPTEVTPAP
jgi:sugar lactone lactonase YvrE